MLKKFIDSFEGFKKNYDIDAYIIPSTDEYQNEYAQERFKRLEYITNFSGSNGIAIVSRDFGVLITDGRYINQASIETDSAFFTVLDQSKVFALKNDVSKNNSENSDLQSLFKGKKIGFDPKLFTEAQINRFKILDIDLVGIGQNLVDLFKEESIEKNYKNTTLSRVYEYKIEFAGRSSEDKLKVLFDCQKQKNIDYIIITDSTIICWLGNIRSHDIEFFPILNCFAVSSKNSLIIYLENAKFRTKDLLNQKNIIFKDLSQLYEDIKNLSGVVSLDKTSCSLSILNAVNNAQNIKSIKNEKNICEHEKAKKCEIEIENFKKFHIHDAISICELMFFISQNLGSITEFDISKKLIEIRTETFGYIIESFPMICGYKENGAIIHYRPNQKTAKTVGKDGLLLIDCGAHYFGCTTDITRTITFSEPTEEQRLMYTLVLMGHVEVATSRFKKGINGSNLDFLARKYLQNIGMDYAHGTGHGVGNFLSVHEGPIAINAINNVPLEAGMVISNEPGFYKNGEYGIRIENLVFVKDSVYDGFLEFENLTLIPYCRKLIKDEILNTNQINYIREYYSKIEDCVLPNLSVGAKDFIKSELLF